VGLLLVAALAAGEALGAEFEAVRLEVPPVIDGILDDAAWTSAASIVGLVQVRPFHGEPSPVVTEVLLGYDDEALYVAFRCADDEPERRASSSSWISTGPESRPLASGSRSTSSMIAIGAASP